MSLTIDAEIERRMAQQDANFEKAERLGQAHLARLAPEMRALALPRGSYVVVNVETGEYVTGPSRYEARMAFKAKYGKSLAWMCRFEGLPVA